MWRDDFDALVHKIDHSGDWDESAFTKRMIHMNADMVGEGFDLGHGILDMCGGMPLAVACMISALAKERGRQEQGLCVVRTRDVQDRIEEQVERNRIQNTPGFEPLVESLELGYKDLPHHMLKTCLLYCSIYPEGHDFKRDDLVRRWMAEGFVYKGEAAEDYFDELVSRGLLFQERGSKGGYKLLFPENDKLYKLHPMMRNYLRRKLREGDFITCTSDGVPSSPVGRLCIDDIWLSSDLGIDWHHIRSLVVFKDTEKVPYKHLQHVRVLDVQYNHVLEQQHLKDMCGLLRLRHLLLGSGGLFSVLGINEMPAEIARLQYLETLEVTATNITRLPAEIGDLKQLKTLVVSYHFGLTELPREMKNLQHLETLRINLAGLGEQAWEIIGTLKKLKTLDVSKNHELSGIPRDIVELQQLKNLDVSHNRGITELPKEIGKLQHLETLDISGTGTTELPREIGNLHRLVYLDLRDTNVIKMPREIGGLQNLKYLKHEVGILPSEAWQLSKLVGLPKCFRQAWKNSDLVFSLAGEILSFIAYDDGGLINHTKHMHIPQWIKEHFNNIGYLDIRICKLEENDLKILREMPYLKNLMLRFEGVPRKPIVISSGGFAKLWKLVVDSQVPRVTFQEGAMPRLIWLAFEIFQFYGGPPNTDPVGINHLVRLEYVVFQCSEWFRRDSPCISSTIDVVTKEAREHPNKITFQVSGKEDETFPENKITQSSEDGSEACSSSGAEEIEEIQA